MLIHVISCTFINYNYFRNNLTKIAKIAWKLATEKIAVWSDLADLCCFKIFTWWYNVEKQKQYVLVIYLLFILNNAKYLFDIKLNWWFYMSVFVIYVSIISIVKKCIYYFIVFLTSIIHTPFSPAGKCVILHHDIKMQ